MLNGSVIGFCARRMETNLEFDQDIGHRGALGGSDCHLGVRAGRNSGAGRIFVLLSEPRRSEWWRSLVVRSRDDAGP
jgi:hypothetical protein